MRRRIAVLAYLVWSAFAVLSQEIGPRVKSTRGEVWPKPAVQNKYDDILRLEPENFRFNVRLTLCMNIINTRQSHVFRFQ